MKIYFARKANFALCHINRSISNLTEMPKCVFTLMKLDFLWLVSLYKISTLSFHAAVVFAKNKKVARILKDTSHL